MKKGWIKEIARDWLALGSIPFFILVLARALVGPYWIFVYQLTIAAVLLLLVFLFIKKMNYGVSRILVLFFFTIAFYNSLVYSIFALVVLVLFAGTLHYLKRDKNEIVKGLGIGLVVSGIAYYLATLLPLLG